MPDPVRTTAAHARGRTRRQQPATFLVAFLVLALLAATVGLASNAGPAAADEDGVVVRSEGELRDAWGDPDVTHIELGDGITFASCFPKVRETDTPVRVDGKGHTVTQGCAHHAFASSGEGSVSLSDLRIVGGISSNPAVDTTVQVHGPLVLGDVRIEGVRAGAVVSDGPIQAGDVTIIGSGGNAITTTAGAGDREALRCRRCRISGNDGNGLVALSDGARAWISGSEITGNRLSGVAVAGTTWLRETTVAGNGTMGIEVLGRVNVFNSTVAGNGRDGVRASDTAPSSGDGLAVAVFSTIVDNGWVNLRGATSTGSYLSVTARAGTANCQAPDTEGTASFADDLSCGLDANSQQGEALDPRLGGLAYDGGPTPTMRPLRGSPLLGAVAWVECYYWVEDWYAEADQRGFPRPATPNGPCDIGAVQLGGAPPHPCPQHFTDVDPSHRFCRDIDWMATNDYSTGWPDHTYRPGLDVSRQALVAFLWRLAGSPPPPSGGPTFSDVPPGHEFGDAIAWLAAEGITTGYDDGTFRPTAPVTRQAFAAMLWRLADQPTPTPVGYPTFDDVDFDHPFHDAISWLSDVQITMGYDDGGFHPADRTSRQAMAAFLHRYAGVHSPNP